jgi:diaminopimelate decarboxylase
MFYDAYHHIVNISNPNGTPRVYTVVGYICETDTFGWDRKLNEVSEGDILCFKNAGLTVYHVIQLQCTLPPAEVMIYQGKAHLIRERENMDDILKNQVEVVK